MIQTTYKNVPVNIIEPLTLTPQVKETYEKWINKRFTDTIIVWSANNDPHDKKPGVMLRPGYNPAKNEGTYKVIKMPVEGNTATIVVKNLIPDKETMEYIIERAKLFWYEPVPVKQDIADENKIFVDIY